MKDVDWVRVFLTISAAGVGLLMGSVVVMILTAPHVPDFIGITAPVALAIGGTGILGTVLSAILSEP